jgi:riboflavin kinase/FMN adenylyltransferase
MSQSNTIIAIGNFDGYHLGHQKIMRLLMDTARKQNLVSLVLTFSPHPRSYFDPEIRLIIPEEEKKIILESLDIDRLIVLEFKKFFEMEGEQFVREVLINRFHMAHVVIGSNFKFGYERHDDIESLKRFSSQYDFDVSVVEPLYHNGVRVSSSEIRRKLNDGKIKEANEMLGWEYHIDGEVTGGDRRGRELGFPTINIISENSIQPPGVFKTRVAIMGKTYDSLTNIGCRPTFKGKEMVVETHIFGFNKHVYGKPVRLFFVEKIRNEVNFQNRDELIKQIRKDIEKSMVDKGA